jgi:hypothetical protein
VSIPPPPSIRERLPAPVCSNAVILLADPNNKSYAGKSYVIFGKTDTGAIDLSKLGGGSKYTIDFKSVNTATAINTGAVACTGLL